MDEQYDDDKSFNFDGISFVVEESLLEQFKSFEIDYSDDWMSQGFVVRSQQGHVSC
ncbi:MAG: hypothetical protein JW702_00745 [Clostridiales bacterium]|nr:hypothetical protein [Clostridiales bacterium]